MDRGVLSSKRGVLITLLLFLSVLLFPMMKVHAEGEHTVKFLSPLYSSNEDNREIYTAQTVADGGLVTKPSITEFTSSDYNPDSSSNYYDKYFIVGWSTKRQSCYGNDTAFENQWDFGTNTVTEDISLYPLYADYRPTYVKNSSGDIIATITKDSASSEIAVLDNVQTKNGGYEDTNNKVPLVKLNLSGIDIPETEHSGTTRSFVGFSFSGGEGDSDFYVKQDDGSYKSLSFFRNDRTYIIPRDAEIWLRLDASESLTLKTEYQRQLSVYDMYFESDGVTRIESTLRESKIFDISMEYSYDALSPEGYEYMGYHFMNPNYVYTETTVNGTATGYTSIFFKYKKVDTKPSGRIEIPVEIEADGETKTDFVVDRTILGGDLIVSIPAEMILEYDSSNEVMTKEDYVSATGRCISTSKLEVKTLTSITYANEADNSIKVPGSIAFGTTSDTYQVTEWSAAELLAGVKDTADIAKKDIKASVLKSDIDFVGSYATSILYNISVLETT